MKSIDMFIDTSVARSVTVRLTIDGQHYVKTTRSPSKAQGVLPLVTEILEERSWQFTDISSVTVHTGPGSYTGLRVGAAIAQTISVLLRIPINGQPPGSAVRLVYDDAKWE